MKKIEDHQGKAKRTEQENLNKCGYRIGQYEIDSSQPSIDNNR